jgi:uncharacterized SAM-binding protein YcdF (DUF218 family)
MKSRIYIYGISILLLIVCLGIFRKAGSWLVKEDQPVHADAIVILMGSISDRVLWAVDIHHAGLASKVIMVETNPPNSDKVVYEEETLGISNTMESRNELVSMGVPADSISIIPGGATSTQMEATLIRAYLKSNTDIDTFLLVSSAEHLRRASMIFNSAFRADGMPVRVICSPSKYTNFNAAKWWSSKQGIQTVVLEYLKMVNFLLFEQKKL